MCAHKTCTTCPSGYWGMQSCAIIAQIEVNMNIVRARSCDEMEWDVSGLPRHSALNSALSPE